MQSTHLINKCYEFRVHFDNFAAKWDEVYNAKDFEEGESNYSLSLSLSLSIPLPQGP
jgi:hypothetical protein